MKTILLETRLKLLTCQPDNTKTGLIKQVWKSKSCLKRNAPTTIVFLKNLMIKLPKLHTRLLAVHSRLSLGPCRMISGQDLLRGHNGMLTLVTCASPVRHWRLSVDPHIRSKPLYALQMEVPSWQTRKPSSSAGQSILNASSATSALCRSLLWPRFPKWVWSLCWMTHPLMKRSRKPQCSWWWASHLALMAFQQKSY